MYEYQNGTIDHVKSIGSLVDAGHHEIAKIVERRMEEFKGE